MTFHQLTVEGLITLAAGILSSMSTCVVPVLAGFSAWLAVMAFTGNGSRAGTGFFGRLAPASAMLFMLGFLAITVIESMPGLLIGRLAWHFQEGLRTAGGVLLIIVGLRAALVDNERNRLAGAGWLSVLAGAALAAGWEPCRTTTLTSVTLLAAVSGLRGQGGALLSLYFLGVALIVLLWGLTINQFLDSAVPGSAYYRWGGRAAGLILTGLGLLIWWGKLGILQPPGASLFQV